MIILLSTYLDPLVMIQVQLPMLPLELQQKQLALPLLVTLSNPAAPVTATAGFNVTGNTAVTGNLNVTGKISNAYSVAVITGNTNAESGYLYVLSGNLTLTLPSSPSTGDHIKVSNRSGVATCVVARNSEKIMGATTDLTLDKLNSGFEMVYSGTAQGWILIGIEGTA